MIPRITFVADKDNNIWTALSNDGNYTAVSPIPHAHIIWPWKGPTKDKSSFSISDGYTVTSIHIHDKANLITYLCTKMWYETVSGSQCLC